MKDRRWPLNESIFTDLGNYEHIIVGAVRLAVAIALGGVLGLEREEEHKSAGMRTHMLVSAGACLFVLAPMQAGASIEHLTRVIQGLTTGIGFLGAGTILKLPKHQVVRGLTTAATIWVTAAVGTAVGIGRLWPALSMAVLALVVLQILRRLDPR